MTKLTSKEELFVNYLVSGKSQRKAYISAGYNVKNKNDVYIDNKASQLFNKPKVKDRFNELMNIFINKSIWTREEAIHQYLWLLNKAKNHIDQYGVSYVSNNAYLGALKGLNKLAFETTIKGRKIQEEIKLLDKRINAMNEGNNNDEKIASYFKLLSKME
ncbi:terminase small subunit [Mammaliicoccus fleurettii]|uniref:Terminase small subunit n=1 Tax=Mammaliicoccus fleurettii TaxID=150056 RepID=A0ABS5MLI4_9STAP|nr:terminase small subunit [Mammaliicoccus fleurettii]MBL0847005.1 terminase small subunit [Mammaliicoccus fleurettii]MBS3671729.1 terminase small subunit [Mammaliicoccus fleurettii]MBS3696773.1 terminase small subunit [Mammaliicoccus fleurettii]